MQYTISVFLPPPEAGEESSIRKYAATSLNIPANKITGYQILKRSVDARKHFVKIVLQLRVFVNEAVYKEENFISHYQDVHHAKNNVLIIGAGPAGLFAALRLIEAGIKPVILERGKDVRSRRRDLAAINKNGLVNPESNYCYGEGGAGTYSDGKLYTRSTRRGDVKRILQLFVHFGADKNILYEAHPHIGTNKLPHIITAMCEQIKSSGGEIYFNQQVTDFLLQKNAITGVQTADGNTWNAQRVILCTGHSARDIFILLQQKNILTEAKPFALGVRVEHPQELINNIQYHGSKDDYLPPASYSLVTQIKSRGVFSFCVCPGGIIAPAATSPGEIVTNGWSPSKRNNPFANSGIVVSVDANDWKKFNYKKELAALYFQQDAEQRAWKCGGGNLVAPAQRLTDFVRKKISADLPSCSYLPGVKSAALNEALPSEIFFCLQEAFKIFGKKMKGYFTEEAIVLATESRTSSPVRIPRDKITLQHLQIKNLYPCGEGAGYAGGIVSAAMDGEHVAAECAEKIKK